MDASFQLEGPDGDGLVWLICDAGSRADWCINLGPVAQVAEVMSQFLGSIDEDEKF